MGRCLNCLGFVALAVALGLGYVTSVKEDFFYRAGQAFKAIAALSVIPEERIKNFLQAYDMFEMDQFTGTPDQMKYVKDYYETLNHLCTIGNYEKMYLPPLLDATKDTYSNQKLYEKRMASRLVIGPGSKVLDIGCGRGKVANLVAKETGAHVTGINIDKDQLGQAVQYAKDTGMSKLLDFREANYNEPLPFPDGHFDAVYYVQVIGGYGTDLKKLFKEVFRVLKPGGFAAFEDYIVYPKYNPADPLQKRYVQKSKAVLGVVHYYTDKEFTDALSGAGFEIIQRKPVSIAPQYKLLESDRDFFLPLTATVTFLKSLGIVPQHFADLLQRMTEGTEDCIEAHRQELVTGDVETLVRKPL
eukprot:SRR837773.11198.p1 GENE.SRR837773.11198~~SRR837773.11198.p1  ORF type:complete len:374 (-),score=177.09 SRR837773.11198:174-1247(-)